jgi:hypothetical protein
MLDVKKPGLSAQTLVPKRDGSGIPDFSSGFSAQPDRTTPMEGYSTFPDHLPHIITFFFGKQFTSVSVSTVPPSLPSPYSCLVPGFTFQSGLGGHNIATILVLIPVGEKPGSPAQAFVPKRAVR